MPEDIIELRIKQLKQWLDSGHIITERNPRLRGTSELARMCFNLDGQYRAGTLNTGSTTNGTERRVNMC